MKRCRIGWASTHFSIGTGSQYSHCIVTQGLEGWPGLGGKPCHDTNFVSWLGQHSYCNRGSLGVVFRDIAAGGGGLLAGSMSQYTWLYRDKLRAWLGVRVTIQSIVS